MKEKSKPSLFSMLFTVLVICSTLFIASCDDTEKVCKKCHADYEKQKKVKQISHFDESSNLLAQYNFFYKNSLIDSIGKEGFGSGGARASAMGIESLKVYYPSGKCIPSYYMLERSGTTNPYAFEKGIMSLTGNVISNKLLVYYEEADFAVADRTAEIKYLYNGDDKVTARDGSDFGIIIYPNPYGNENSYTYTGDNVTKVDAYQEQAGYDLNKTFDNKNNAFNIQSNVFFFLDLIGYNDLEYFETLALDKNNVTQIIYEGTDTSNSVLTITYTFTYTYTVDNYPATVNIHELREDELHGDSETDLGTYHFEYY